MSAKLIAFQRGLAMLRASGATFAVVYDDKTYTSDHLEWAMKLNGTVLGNLTLQAPTPIKGKRVMKGPRKSWIHTGYLDAMKVMTPGANWTYQALDKAEAQSLQKTIAGRAGQLWGIGKFITTVDPDFKVELLRVE